MQSEKLIEVFNDINDIFIKKINVSKRVIDNIIEQELFDDCINTYKRAYRLVLNNRLLDGLVLTRNSFELMMMLFGMRIDNNVKKEYCRANSYERYIERRSLSRKEKDYLSQSYLRKLILKKYSNIEEDYTKIYNILSKYAHPTIYRNALSYYERENIDVIIMFLNVIMILPVLFLEILYEEKLCTYSDFKDIGIFKYIVERIFLIYFIKDVDIKRLSEANKYAFVEINEEYYYNVKSEIQNDFIDMENDIKDNEENIKDLITNLLSKTEYIEITQKIIDLELGEEI